MTPVEKVTISVSQEALAAVDRPAEEEQRSRSGVFTYPIECEQRRRLEESIARGYKELAEVSRKEVEDLLPAQAEVVSKDD